MQQLAVGVDSGGTFTDFVAAREDGTVIAASKWPTTKPDPSVAILEGYRRFLSRLCEHNREVLMFAHGTTIGTNALLERRGARTALLLTEGTRDITVIGRQARPKLYDWFATRPEPIVPRNLCREIPERLSFLGATLRPLCRESVIDVLDQLALQEVSAIAVCLLHSYANPEHERQVGDIVAEVIPDVACSLSVDVHPEIGEYERAMTTAVNAYLTPIVSRYIDRLTVGLSQLGMMSPMYVMQNNGGLTTARSVASRAVNTILSGPAAGVIGALGSVEGSSKESFLTVDMGGTSFDIALSDGRRARFTRATIIDTLPIAVPALEIHTLGAGGGSIAWVDKGGVVQVGPSSAGSFPGPAAYGRGGEFPTVTDANLALGRLGDEPIGGELRLDRSAAERAIERYLAHPLGVDLTTAARAVLTVVNAAMAKGMRVMSIGRGQDPRSVALVAFGGAGPLHAAELAEEISCDEVIVPALPGNTSAVGLLLADVRREVSTSILRRLDELEPDDLDEVIRRLRMAALQALEEEGVAPDRIRLSLVARMAYEGQAYKLDVPWGALDKTNRGKLVGLGNQFVAAHRKAYGYVREEDRIAIDSLWMSAFGSTLDSRERLLSFAETDSAPEVTKERRLVWFEDDFYPVSVFSKPDVMERRRVKGPAIVVQNDTTVVIPPSWLAEVLPSGGMLLRRAV